MTTTRRTLNLNFIFSSPFFKTSLLSLSTISLLWGRRGRQWEGSFYFSYARGRAAVPATGHFILERALLLYFLLFLYGRAWAFLFHLFSILTFETFYSSVEWRGKEDFLLSLFSSLPLSLLRPDYSHCIFPGISRLGGMENTLERAPLGPFTHWPLPPPSSPILWEVLTQAFSRR